MDGPSGFGIFIGIISAIIFACVLGFASALARGSVAGDCKRDGFTWIDGVRYECKPAAKS